MSDHEPAGTRLLTPEISALVGSERTYRAPEELGRAAIRYFARAIGDDNPLYLDDEVARAHGRPSVIAPPTLVCETNQLVDLPRDASGYAGHRWGIEIPGTRVVRGGNDYRFVQEVTPGDVVTTTWRITGADERTSGSGAALLVISSEATYTNQHGELLAVNTETIIYQELA